LKHLPIELSTSQLNIKNEQQAFANAKASGLYEMMSHYLQTAMIERFVTQILHGQEVDIVDEKEQQGVYVCVDSEHSQIYAFSSNNPDANFLTEASEGTLELRVQKMKKKTVIDWINEFKEETPFAKIFKLPNVTPEQLKQAALNIMNLPKFLSPELIKYLTKEYPEFKKTKTAETGKIGWGFGLYGSSHLPSERNCHAFIYATLVHVTLGMLKGHEVDESVKNSIMKTNFGKGQL
jgi:hypothetical protein